jgi:1,4-alpha-glucan branching enzyme
MYGHPGKKLLFMGADLGEWDEWNHDRSLDWHLLGEKANAGVNAWVRDLNREYHKNPALHDLDFNSNGFAWVNMGDAGSSIISFIRNGRGGEKVLVVCNNTPVPRVGYSVGVPSGGVWTEILNSDAKEYGGSGMGNMGKVEARRGETDGRQYFLQVTLPPLSAIFFESPGRDTPPRTDITVK